MFCLPSWRVIGISRLRVEFGEVRKYQMSQKGSSMWCTTNMIQDDNWSLWYTWCPRYSLKHEQYGYGATMDIPRNHAWAGWGHKLHWFSSSSRDGRTLKENRLEKITLKGTLWYVKTIPTLKMPHVTRRWSPVFTTVFTNRVVQWHGHDINSLQNKMFRNLSIVCNGAIHLRLLYEDLALRNKQ